jgi:hypothetical protein
MFSAITSRPGAVLAAALGLAVLTGCDRKPTPAPRPKPATSSPSPLAAPSAPRADLLDAIARTRAAYAAGADNPSAELSGRRFSVRQAFGCGGPADAALPGEARWSWDGARKSIKISLAPADWTHAPILAGVKAAEAGRWEAVEGFWLTHPWLRTEGCPMPPIIPAAETALPPTAAAPTAGLAAVFEAGGSRVDRRDGRAYALTLRGEPTAEPPLAGYRLLLEGRFTAYPDGPVIRCRSDNPDTEPVCLAAAEVDRVAIEDAAGKVLREWRKG